MSTCGQLQNIYIGIWQVGIWGQRNIRTV